MEMQPMRTVVSHLEDLYLTQLKNAKRVWNGDWKKQ